MTSIVGFIHGSCRGLYNAGTSVVRFEKRNRLVGGIKLLRHGLKAAKVPNSVLSERKESIAGIDIIHTH